MTAKTEKLEWGCTSYTRDHAFEFLGAHPRGVDMGDRKCYIGRFYAQDGPMGFWRSTIRFWAHRPILALREIVNSGRHPSDFADKAVN